MILSVFRTEYQLLLMKITVRDRNIRINNVFGCVLRNFDCIKVQDDIVCVVQQAT